MFNRLLCGLLATAGEGITRPLKCSASVFISKDKFRVILQLKGWAIDEIRVKAHPNYLVIEGKHELDTEEGMKILKFTRKFKLPKDCSVNKIKSKFSTDDVLTVDAVRSPCELDLCDTVIIPIKSEGNLRGPKTKNNDPCGKYPKVKPRPPPEKEKK